MQNTKKSGKKPKRKPGEPRENPISLAPLDFETALAGLLAVEPEPKHKKKPEQEENKKPGLIAGLLAVSDVVHRLGFVKYTIPEIAS